MPPTSGPIRFIALPLMSSMWRKASKTMSSSRLASCLSRARRCRTAASQLCALTPWRRSNTAGTSNHSSSSSTLMAPTSSPDHRKFTSRLLDRRIHRAKGLTDPVDPSKAQNAALETFFKAIKAELIGCRSWQTPCQAEQPSSNTSTAFITRAVGIQHWEEKAPWPLSAKQPERAPGAAQIRDRSSKNLTRKLPIRPASPRPCEDSS